MGRRIIVSDLHADTWDRDERFGQGDRYKTKLEHWCDFLDFCEGKRIDELIINGDIMDAPPYQGDLCFISDVVQEAVGQLLIYAKKHKVTYIYGNHDIGISGIRCGFGIVPGLPDINLVYPNYVPPDGSTILVQHGHLYDPVMCLYVRDLDVRTYILSKGQALQWVQQRRDLHTGQRLQSPGVSSPAVINLAAQEKNNVYYAIRDTQAARKPSGVVINHAHDWVQYLQEIWNSHPATPAGFLDGLLSSVEELIHGGWQKVEDGAKDYIWREAAESIFNGYVKEKPADSGPIYCVMGHTHIPDTFDLTIDGKNCRYFNSGTWTGEGAADEDRAHATYLDVREEEGVDPAKRGVWIQDWIRDPYLGD